MSSPIGLLGGTFDPIHLGHLHMALSVYHGLQLQAVRLLPTGIPNLRDMPLASPEQRLAMVRLAIEDHPHLQVDEREIYAENDISYTIDSLMAIRAEEDDTPLCFIIGVDQLQQMDQWYEWRRILDFAHLVVSSRPVSFDEIPRFARDDIHAIPSAMPVIPSAMPVIPSAMPVIPSEARDLIGADMQAWVSRHQVLDYQQLHQQAAGCIFFLPIIPLAISATDVRYQICQKNTAVRYNLSPKVWDYIGQTNLYS